MKSVEEMKCLIIQSSAITIQYLVHFYPYIRIYLYMCVYIYIHTYIPEYDEDDKRN